MRIAALALPLCLFAQDAPPLPPDTLPADFHRGTVPEGLPADLPRLEADREPVLRLGRSLFFDPILSRDRSVSCASCHEPDHGFSSREALPRGALGRRALRNAPTLYNRVLGTRQMWDGRFSTLREQVVQPILNENEMVMTMADALARLREDAEYARRFQDVFGAAPSAENLAEALATFVENLLLGSSPIDLFRAAEENSLTTEEKAGLWLFESKGGCWKCHAGPNFSDESMHNTGVGVVEGRPADGYFVVTGDPADRGRFKTPTLRGLAHTAPYMHDGSLATLADVVEFYRRGGNDNPNRDPKLRPLELTDEDAAHLVAFLEALSRVEAPEAR